MTGPDEDVPREVVLRPASAMRPRRPRWVWENRWPRGEVALTAGKGGLGKSTICYWAAARLTRGELPGEYLGQPRAVLVCATEDSWEYTILPRLIAAGADLTMVFSIEVVESDGGEGWLVLPKDVREVYKLAVQEQAILLILDPLMSRLASSLDTHRDADVRRALEPLKRMAAAAEMTVVGLIHVNKGIATDPLGAVMGSAAFTNVSRSVSVVVPDPEDPTERRRLFGTPKNNLGRDDLPTLAFSIVEATVPTEEGPTPTGRVEWHGEVAGSIRDAMVAGQADDFTRSAVSEAGEWLVDWLAEQGGESERAEIEREGKKQGHSIDSLKRARVKRGVVSRSEGFPRHTIWFLSVQSVQSVQSDDDAGIGSDKPAEHRVGAPPQLPAPTALTAPTGPDLQVSNGVPAPTAAPTEATAVGADGAAGAVGAVGAQTARPPLRFTDYDDLLGEMCPDCRWRGRHAPSCSRPLLPAGEAS